MKSIPTPTIHRLVGIAFRASAAVSCLSLVDNSLHYVDSMPWRMVRAGGEPARWGAWLLGAIAAIALLDVLLCDVLHVRRLAVLRRLRPLVWSAVAVGYASQSFVALWYGFFPRLALLYFAQALVCLVIAWTEMALRYDRQCTRQRESGFVPLDDA